MNKFFTQYADLIIKGVIYMPQHKFWQRAELDDLIQEARTALIISIHKNQWKKEKGNIFNFFTTVIVRSLINFTRRNNRFQETDADIDALYNNESMKYYYNYEKQFIMQDIFKELKQFFYGKKKFIILTKLLEHYYYDHVGNKFVKKEFIEFARAHNLSPAITNTFFAYLKRIVHHKDQNIQELLKDEFDG